MGMWELVVVLIVGLVVLGPRALASCDPHGKPLDKDDKVFGKLGESRGQRRIKSA